MPIDFPPDPVTNQNVSQGDMVWKYDGQKWVLISGVTPVSSAAGPGLVPSNMWVRPNVVWSSGRSHGGNAGYPTYQPFYVSGNRTFTKIGCTTTTVTTSGVVRLGIYANDNGVPGSLLLDAGTINYSANNTSYTITISKSFANQWIWLCGVIQSGSSTWLGPDAYATQPYYGYMTSPTSSGSQSQLFSLSAVSGALPDPAPTPVPYGWSTLGIYLEMAAA